MEQIPIQDEMSPIQYDRSPTPISSVIENVTTRIIEVDNTNIFDGIVKSDDQNNLHFVWTKGDESRSSIFYRLFNYSTQKWSSAINISKDKPIDAKDYEPDVVSFQNKIYITWTRNANQESSPPRNIMFGIVQGTQILQDEIQLTSSNSEYSPSIHISPQGKILILDISAGTQDSAIFGYMANIGQSSFHSYYWTYINVVTLLDTLPLTILEYAAFWEHLENDTLHILFRANQQSIQNRIYYGKNESNLGGTAADAFNQSQIIQITAENPVGTDSRSNLLIAGNTRNRMIYFGWEQGTSGTKNITIYNKTMDSLTYDPTPCLASPNSDYHSPSLTFDLSNNPILVFHIGTVSCQIYYYRGFSNPTQPLVSGGNIGYYPVITSTPKGDAFVAYLTDTTPIKFNFKQLDLTPPNLQILNPANNSVITGNVMLAVSVEPDTIKVNYSYYIDANLNGIEDDSPNTWQLIKEYTTEVNYSTGELENIQNFAFEWVLGNSDQKGILIRVEAFDKNGLNATRELNNIKIDNNKPERVKFISVLDEYGNNGESAKFGRGNITFTFDAYDNCSGIQKVELRNGTLENSQLLVDNSTMINLQANQIVWESKKSPDGNYTHLYLRAYDGTGFYNTTVENYSIFVDNTKPLLIFTSPQANGEYSKTFNITMLAANDTQQIDVKYKNSTMGNYGNIGLATKMNQTGWEIQWITNAPYLNGNYTIYANVTDLYGNHELYGLNVSIDNLQPTIKYVMPYSNFKVGLILNITILVDADTVKTEFGYKTESMTYYYWIYAANVAENATFGSNGTHLYISMRIMLDQIPPSVSEIPIGIIVNCTDNQGLSAESLMNGKLVSEIPPQPNQFGDSEYEANGTLHNVKIVFYFNGQKLLTLDKYLIYRSLMPLPVTLLNVQMNGLGRLQYLGESVGEKYCIGQLTLEEVESLKDSTFPIYYDRNVSANTYYYYVLGLNIYGTPGLISEGVNITVPLTTTSKEINLKDLQLMPYVFLGVVVVMGFVALSMVKATKSVRKTREINKTVLDISKQYNIEERDGAKSLSDRLDDMEASLDGGKEVKKGKLIPKKPEKAIDIDDFLNMKVETKKQESVIASGTIRKCAGCGWALSSTAVKCPKCGRVVL